MKTGILNRSYNKVHMWIRLAYLYILCFDKAFEIFLKVFKFSDPVLSPVNHLPKPGPGPGPLKNTGDNRGRGPRSDVSADVVDAWV